MTASSSTPAVRWARDIEPPEFVVSVSDKITLTRGPDVCFLGNAYKPFRCLMPPRG